MRRHRPVSELDIPMRLLLPGKRVLHPVLVVAIWEIFAGVRAARFFAIGCRFGGLDAVKNS
jgi:hypothetical protein